MVQVRREPLADQAARLLLERVRSGEWELGEKLPGETTLAPQLGVGRSTVREAIRLLAGRGMLAARQGAGVFVTALDVADDWDDVVRRSDLTAVIEARIAIETEAAALAAQRRTRPDIRVLRDTLAARADETLSRDDYVVADLAFHRAVVAASHNPILVELFDGFTPRLRESMQDLVRRRPTGGADVDHEDHVALADAIIDRDPIRAAAASRAHLTAVKEFLS